LAEKKSKAALGWKPTGRLIMILAFMSTWQNFVAAFLPPSACLKPARTVGKPTSLPHTLILDKSLTMFE
jgi:hypothetical protein